MDKNPIDQKLDSVIAALSAEDLDFDKIEHGWYSGVLFPEDEDSSFESEVELAEEAIQYPELHDKMREIVRLITKLNDHTYSYAIWEDEQVQAGGGFATELAITNLSDVMLYARYVSTNDLNHEVDQAGNMADIIGTWGWNKDTYAVLAARFFTPGQFADEFMEGESEDIIASLDADGAVEDFLKMTARWFIEGWFRWYTVENHQERIQELFEILLAEKFELGEEEISALTDRFVALVTEGTIPKWSDLQG